MFDVYYATQIATIAASGSLSEAVELRGGTPIRLLMPSGWTAAAITFQISPDGVTYYDLYDKNGVEYTVQVAASRAYILPPIDTTTIKYLKVRSGTAGTPVNQAAERVITLETKLL